MKFEEKLMKLRKENAMSQEELGEKLNVTRQTISKWELGQTKPDTDKLAEIAKLFNTTTDDLLNEEDDIKTKKQINPDNGNKRNIIIVIILVVVLLVALGSIPVFIFTKVFNTGSGFFNTISNNFNTISNKISTAAEEQKSKIDETPDMFKKLNSNYDKINYNSTYESSYTGLQSKFFTEQAIKRVIQDNINHERKITVTYNGISAKESEELVNLKSSLDKSEYLITYDYDVDGYINQMNIKDV